MILLPSVSSRTRDSIVTLSEHGIHAPCMRDIAGYLRENSVLLLTSQKTIPLPSDTAGIIAP